ncbi:hypothetical protein ACGFNU_43980 [Spirillospora sp. NPDC048911]
MPERIALINFVDPEISEPLHPWTGDQSVDLRDKPETDPAAFGLPEMPLL